MEDGCSSDPELDISYEAEDLEAAQPEPNFPRPPSANTKRSRRSVQKRVVSIPISEIEAIRGKGGAGEGAPPSDSWTWRKYGQKPIKGSPYPRGYYRCSSSKGCPARKQVERSREDPSTIVVTYSFDHSHSSAQAKNRDKRAMALTVLSAPAVEKQEDLQVVEEKGTEFSTPESEEKFSDLVGEDCGAFRWLTEGCSTSYGSMFSVEAASWGWPEEGAENGGGGGGEEDGLFEGLEELPEWSVVFRRGMTSASGIGTA